MLGYPETRRRGADTHARQARKTNSRRRQMNSGLPSWLQKPLKVLSNLFMGEICAPLESFLAALHGPDETRFFVEIARKRVLHQFVRSAALPGGGVRQLRFEFGCEPDFHCLGFFSQDTSITPGAIILLPRV